MYARKAALTSRRGGECELVLWDTFVQCACAAPVMLDTLMPSVCSISSSSCNLAVDTHRWCFSLVLWDAVMPSVCVCVCVHACTCV